MGILPARKNVARLRSRALAGILILAGVGVVLQPPELRALDYDQLTVERELENNRKFIRFLDLSVTNMRKAEPGTDYEDLQKSIEKEFYEMLQKDYDANLHYLRREFPKSVASLVESRRIMQKLYREVLENYLEETDILLQAATPPILKTTDAHSRHFLEMGFRNFNLARASHTRGYNIHVYQLGNQIRYYQEGIEQAREARRYAILGHIYARLPFEEKPENQFVTLDDLHRERSDQTAAQENFQKTLSLLGTLIARKVMEPNLQWNREGHTVTLNLVQIHEDDYGMVIPGRSSLWQRLADRLEEASFAPGAQSPLPGSPGGPNPGTTGGAGVDAAGSTGNSSVNPGATGGTPSLSGPAPAAPAAPGTQTTPP